MSEKDRQKKLADAKQKVIQAAVNYVNFEDGGTVKNLYQLTDLQIGLADAVTDLEKLQTLKVDEPTVPVDRTKLEALKDGYLADGALTNVLTRMRDVLREDGPKDLARGSIKLDVDDQTAMKQQSRLQRLMDNSK